MPEVIIYHHLYNKKYGTCYMAEAPVSADLIPTVAAKSWDISSIFSGIAKGMAITGLALMLITYTPSALAWSKNVLASNITNYKPSQTEVALSSTVQTKPNYLPPLDPTLPSENRIIIPSIGVKTDLQEATLDNYEEALKKGVWRVSNFGSPEDRSRPTILAAHRFGYLSWTNDFRYKNSFFNLPNLKIGDTVEIDYGKRKYVYEVYSQSEGPEITDYGADLILYTCKDLTGPTRIFKYAKLITN